MDFVSSRIRKMSNASPEEERGRLMDTLQDTPMTRVTHFTSSVTDGLREWAATFSIPSSARKSITAAKIRWVTVFTKSLSMANKGL